MKIRKFLSTLLACMLIVSLLPSAEAIDCAIYDAYAAPVSVTAHPAPDAGPRSFTTAEADEAAGDGVCFHPYVFTVGEDASVSASVRLQPALMAMSERATLLAEAAPDELEGNGTYELPYRIGTRAQLEKFRDLVNNGDAEACAVLINDIDLENTAWTPINDFAGSFEGGGYVISGLKVLTSSAGQYAGLFGSINVGSVRHLGVQGSVQATSNANGYDAYAGGIAGYSSSGYIAECWFNGTVSASATNNASAYAGGIAGSLSAGDLSNSYSLGEVRAESAYVVAYAGGVAGYIEGEVYACYHKEGDVTAGTHGAAFIGGVAGKGGVDYLPYQCYYLEGTAPSGFDGENMTGKAEPLTAAQFAQTESFCVIDSAKSWDFADTWRMDETEGRPMLKKGILLNVEVADVSFGDVMVCNITLSAVDAKGSIALTASSRETEETFALEISEGKATQSITASCSGTYNLTAVYSGDDRYLPCVARASFQVDTPFAEVSSQEELRRAITNGGLVILKNNIFNQTDHFLIPQDKNITIDLNGFSIDHSLVDVEANGSIFLVESGGNLTIIDSSGGGAITGGNATDGGAVYVANGGSFTVGNVSFINNVAQLYGGAIFAAPGASLSVIDCAFINNTANSHSAVSLRNAAASISRSVFINNTAAEGVVGSLNSSHVINNVTNCIFVGNKAEGGVFSFADNENASTDFNWFGQTAKDYTINQDAQAAEAWYFVNITRTIDSSTGQYAFNAALGRYNSTSLNLTPVIAPKDYPLPTIMLDGGVQGADIDAAEASAGGIHLLTRGAENDAAGAVLMLSRAGYSSINFTPSVDSTNYTVSFSYPGHPEICENRTFVRTLKAKSAGGEESLDFNDTESGPILVVNLTALENGEAVPNAVLKGKTVSVNIGGEVSNYTVMSNGVFEMSPGNATPGTHDALITVAGFAPLAVNITTPKYHTPLNVTAPEYVVIGEDVLISAQVPENATQNVTMNIRGGAGYDETYCANITDGKGAVTVSGLPVGAYTVNITYSGDDNYLENSTSISFRVVEEENTPVPAPSYVYSPPAPKETRFDEVDLSKGSLDNFKRSRTYTDGLFSDVNPKGWYFENVAAAYEFALMEGMGDGTFGVGARLKLSEALALACRMHNIYYGGSGRFDQTKDANWYTVYEDYAVKYGIIRKGEFDLTGDATRAQFAAIISAALPDAALKPINDVKELPDMRADDPRLPAILRLYNAGILTGMDGQGSFRPDASIPREQIAAMATRVADPALRKAFTLS